MRDSKIFRSIAAILLLAVGWLWTGAKAMMDWAGRATVLEDLDHAQGLLANGAAWLFSTPSWVPAALATVLTAVFIFYLVRTERNDSVLGTEKTKTPLTSTRLIDYDPKFNHRRRSDDGKQWITIRLNFRTDRTVNHANAYLLCAQRYENGAWQPDTLAGMRILLSWPGSGNRFEPRTVYKEDFILLLDYDVEADRLSFVDDKKHTPYSLKPFVDDVCPGKYLLLIGVGDDMEMIKETFMLDWFGNFASLSLQRVSRECPC